MVRAKVKRQANKTAPADGQCREEGKPTSIIEKCGLFKNTY
jgi:hypothetical protein